MYASGPRKRVFSAVYLPCEMTTPPPKLSPTLPMFRKTPKIRFCCRACGCSHGRKPLQWLYSVDVDGILLLITIFCFEIDYGQFLCLYIDFLNWFYWFVFSCGELPRVRWVAMGSHANQIYNKETLDHQVSCCKVAQADQKQSVTMTK